MNMEDINIDKYILGETDEEFLCTGEENNQQITLAMIQQTELHLDILSRDFDPDVYDNPDCCEAIEDLALLSRHSRIRILLHDSKKVAQRGHLMFHLGRRLGSLINFRSVAEVHKSIPDTFLIADGIGIIHRPYTDTLSATVNFKDRPKVKEFTQLFEKIWQNAEPDLESRYVVV
jgi:hypothetical protein